MITADLSRKRQKEVVDKMAASFILQGVLDTLKRMEVNNT
jgi:RNase H-fold protein (predicted Holliday junction resolvase)